MTTWTINPFVRPLGTPDEHAHAGECDLPADFPHCHGAEIQHVDGTAECISHAGTCDAPEPGRHPVTHRCAPEYRRALGYVHWCSWCR